MGKVVSGITDALGLTDVKGTQERADRAAAAQARAARDAAEMARFKPYNISSALGSVRFGDQTVDINYNPALARYRDALFGLAATGLPQDLRAAEEEEYQRLLAGSRGALEQQTAQLGQGLFRSGRQGLDIYGANPETRAFAASLMDRELALRQAAEAQIANRIAQSTGLFSSGAGVEATLMQPLELGANLGGRAAQAGAQAGQLLSQGLQASALTQQRGGDAASAQLTGFMNQALNAAIGSMGGSGGFGGFRMPNFGTASIYNTNPFSQQTAMLAEQDRYFR